MVFTTKGDVSELRRRVGRMAEMHNQNHGQGQGQKTGIHGSQQGGMRMKGGGMMMPPSTARSEDVEGGSRLVLTPRAPADLPKLRDHVGQHAEMMASGRCPMKSMHRQGAESGETR
ncbi:MAG TPA: hypothetical protein VGB13_03915 [Candidatus Krumholzibacteria bacterium]